MGSALPLTVSVKEIAGGPLLSLFLLGMLFPKANTKGALCGGVASLLFNSFIVIGNKYYQRMGTLEDFSKSVSTKGCDFYVNVTLPSNIVDSSEKPFVLFRIAFWYYTFVGAVVVIVIGLIVSWCTKKDDPPVHPDPISPVVRYWTTKESRVVASDYCSTEEAVELVTYTQHQKGY